MNTYTSGYRTAHGLPPANHDPHPWAFSRTSPDRENGPFGHSDRAATRVDAAMLWFPRPEFDVPDNPILVVFRGRLRYDKTSEWVEYLDSGIWSAWRNWTPKQVAHARRVLSKLAAVYA